MRSRLDREVRVMDEEDFVPGVRLDELRRLPAPHFPRAAGWYFQQLLKLQFAFIEPDDDYYLIWDADTVPLRSMTFFDADGRMLLTRATEFHAPYFETYRRLLGEEPHREFSLIAQHMLVQKSLAREMLGRIELHVRGDGNWAWKIMRSLPPTGDNLFSEYETYGHYVKNHHPDRVQFVDRSWRREFCQNTGQAVPSGKDLAALARQYDYVAFERAGGGWRRWARALFGRLKR
jgi:hypothetical protein